MHDARMLRRQAPQARARLRSQEDHRLLFTLLTAAALLALLLFAPALIPRAHASTQSAWTTSGCSDRDGHSGGWNSERFCETRSAVLTLDAAHLAVQSTNGGIDVRGEDRADVSIEARVEGWANSKSRAEEIVRKVEIETSGDSIRDKSPDHSWSWHNQGYAVSYILRVPRRLAVNLNTTNGGIEIAHLDGEIRFETTNGGVKLNDLSGKVKGETTNGGLSIILTGDRWHGDGLDAQTTNGGLHMTVPEHYSAHLETETTNGGIQIDFPISVQGRIGKHLSVDLGSGGPTIHAETTNGGVTLSHHRESGGGDGPV